MKILSIFAVFKTKNNFTQNVGSYFYDYTIGTDICKDKEAINPQLATTFACFSCSWSRMWRGSLSSFYTYLNFHSMTRSNENVGKVNNSTLTSSSAHDTGIQPSFESLIAEIQQRFEIEKQEKNKAYEFILSYGLLDSYIAFIYENSSITQNLNEEQ